MIYIFKDLEPNATFEQFYNEYKIFFWDDYTEKENEKSGLIKNQNDEFIRINREGNVELWIDDDSDDTKILIKDYSVYFDSWLNEYGFIADFYETNMTLEFLKFSDYDEFFNELTKYAKENNLKKVVYCDRNEYDSDIFYTKDVETVKDFLKDNYYLLDDEVEENLKEY